MKNHVTKVSSEIVRKNVIAHMENVTQKRDNVSVQLAGKVGTTFLCQKYFELFIKYSILWFGL